MRRWTAEVTTDGHTTKIDGPRAMRIAYEMCGWRKPRDYFLCGVLAGVWLIFVLTTAVQMARA